MMQQTLPSRRRANKKNQFSPDVKLVDAYKFYKKKYGTPSKTGVTRKLYGEVTKEFNLFVGDRIVKGDRMILPFGLGSLEVLKKKQRYEIIDGKINTKALLVDWSKTYEYWKTNEKARESKKLLYYTGDNGENYRYKFNWDKYGIINRRIRNYSFKATRHLSRKLAAYIHDPDTIKNYYEKC